jgi:hypothetical protein
VIFAVLGAPGSASSCARSSTPWRLSDLREAVDDAREYRALGLPEIDTTARTPTEVAVMLAALVQRLGPV